MFKCVLCLFKQIKIRRKKKYTGASNPTLTREQSNMDSSLSHTALYRHVFGTRLISFAEISVMLKPKLEKYKQKRTAPKPALYVSQLSVTASSCDHREQDNRLLFSTVPSEHTRECSLVNRHLYSIYLYTMQLTFYLLFLFI